MTIFDYLEITRAVTYAICVLASLYLCIESSNANDKATAGMYGALSLLYGSLLMSVASRYLGMGHIESRSIITPAILLHASTLLALIYRIARRV